MADLKTGEDRTIEKMHLKYVELLEKRIDQLEVLVNQPPSTRPDPPDMSALRPDSMNMSFHDLDAEEKGLDSGELKSGRYRNILRKFDRMTGRYKEEFFQPGKLNTDTIEEDWAYTFRTYEWDKEPLSEIEIKDGKLIKLLKDVIGRYPGLNYDTEMLFMDSPFPAIIHYWDKLSEHVQKYPEEQTCKDLNSLMEQVKNTPGLETFFKMRDSSTDAKVVDFDTLWTAFTPGKMIVAWPFMAEVPQIMFIGDSPFHPGPGFRDRDHPPRLRSLWAWTWDWDGRRLVKVYHEFTMEVFPGTKKVTELSVVPLESYDKAEELKEKVRERSRKFFKYTVGAQSNAGMDQVLYYDNLGWADERKTLAEDEGINRDQDRLMRPGNLMGMHEEEFAGNPVTIKGDFISDAAEYVRTSSYKNYPIGMLGRRRLVQRTQLDAEDEYEFRELVNKLFKDDQAWEKPLDPENDNFLATAPRLLGYATQQRIWGQICLDWADPKKPADKEGFRKKLQLNSHDKNMIMSLVEAHMQNKDKKVKDIVENKGQGLVLLLHGPPGVGKTLTAETVAQATGRPLFVVSVAEIGLDASNAERKLEKVFSLATKWQAILLIDEADVFLETRSKNSQPSRNALVSVLLRVLEYYEGIIIMTTNRIRAIDVAVISRIHLAVRYDDLTDVQRNHIFEYYLNQLQNEVPNLITDDDRDKMNDFILDHGATYPFNGRQIRNVVQAAHAYAVHSFSEDDLREMRRDEEVSTELNVLRRRKKYREQAARRADGKMTVVHLQAVCDMTRLFQEQLKEESNSQRNENEAMRGFK